MTQELLGFILFLGMTTLAVILIDAIIPQTIFGLILCGIVTTAFIWLVWFLYKASKEPNGDMHANAPAGAAVLKLMIIAAGWVGMIWVTVTAIQIWKMFH